MGPQEWLDKACQAEYVVLDVENRYYASRTRHDMPDLPDGRPFAVALQEWEIERSPTGKVKDGEVKYKWQLSDELLRHVRTWDGYMFAIGFAANGLPDLVWSELNGGHVGRAEIAAFILALIRSAPTVAHNSAHDVRIIKKNFNIPFSEYRMMHDSMLLHNVLHSEMKHDLNHLSSIYSTQNRHKFLGTHSEIYLQGDVRTTLEVWYNLLAEANRDPQSWKIYLELQLPMLPHILKAHETGVRINRPFMGKMQTELEAQREKAQHVANTFVAGFNSGNMVPDPDRTINLNSSPQKSTWIYGHCGLKLPGLRKGKSGAYPLRKDQVAALQDTFFFRDDNDTFESRLANGGHPLVESIAAFTQADKFLSSYITPFDFTERMYPNFKLHGQATGRWSTTGPNLPGMNKKLKPIIIPDEGEVWVGGDWSNAELRIMAELSGDELLKRGFREGWDLHSMHCAQAFGWDSPRGRYEWAKALRKIDDELPWEEFDYVRNGDWWGRVAPNMWKKEKVEPEFDWVRWIVEGGPQPGWLADDDLFRRFCKILVFRLAYGGSPKTASKIPGATSLGLVPARLVQASNDLIAAHLCWQEYWDDMGTKAIEQRIVRNPNGRARRLMDKDPNARFRKGVNFPIQSWVSDLLNRTLIRILDACPWARLVYTCHDSFYVGAPMERCDELAEVVIEAAEAPLRDDFFIPFDMERITYDEDSQVRTLEGWEDGQWEAKKAA